MKFIKKIASTYIIVGAGETEISFNYSLSELLRSSNIDKIKDALQDQNLDLDTFVALEPQYGEMPHKANLLTSQGWHFHDATGFLASGKDVDKLIAFLKKHLSKMRHAKMWVNGKVVLDNFEKEVTDIEYDR